MRLRTEDIARHVRIPGGASAADLELRDWLATPLTALDGGVIGALHLISESDDKFTSLDEAVVVHVAQMSAAAIERARLYGRAAR
jgi:GAF domain-containing protein